VGTGASTCAVPSCLPPHFPLYLSHCVSLLHAVPSLSPSLSLSSRPRSYAFSV
jgi:hypothetical protein